MGEDPGVAGALSVYAQIDVCYSPPPVSQTVRKLSEPVGFGS